MDDRALLDKRLPGQQRHGPQLLFGPKLIGSDRALIENLPIERRMAMRVGRQLAKLQQLSVQQRRSTQPLGLFKLEQLGE